jgi:hypothetical protein
MRASRIGFASLVGLLVSVAGCGSSAMKAAEQGDLATLKREIASRETAGDLSNDEAASLAKVVAEREIRTAKGKDAAERVREVRACARELDGVLAERMQTQDEAGAEAALARLEGGKLDPDDVRLYAAAPDDWWRSVGTRGLVREEDRVQRQHAMLDPVPRVRRQAMRAAQLAVDPADFDPLAEAARVDPEPILRTEAVRAIAALPPQAGGGVANRLRDLWTGADDGIREDIALAWASPNIFAAGGREALVVLLASGNGPGVIEGAAALMRSWEVRDQESLNVAIAQVLRAIGAGAKYHRMHAIAVARIDKNKDLFDAVVKASDDDDPEVRIAALSRLTEMDSQRPRAIKLLEAYAALGKGGPGGGPLALRAKLALASAGDITVQQWIEADLAAPTTYERLAAATDLAALGRSARAAPLLADPDASVRTRAACTLIMAARVHK